MKSKDLERVVNDQLEDFDLGEFFELFDITAFEIVELAYENGLLDEDILMKMLPTDGI